MKQAVHLRSSTRRFAHLVANGLSRVRPFRQRLQADYIALMYLALPFLALPCSFEAPWNTNGRADIHRAARKLAANCSSWLMYQTSNYITPPDAIETQSESSFHIKPSTQSTSLICTEHVSLRYLLPATLTINKSP